MIRLVEKEHFIIVMATDLKAVGKMESRKIKEYIITVMELNMMANGKMIKRMA